MTLEDFKRSKFNLYTVPKLRLFVLFRQADTPRILQLMQLSGLSHWHKTD